MKFRLAAAATIVMLWAGPAFGQGCAMCYSTARAVAKDGQRAISGGVLVMIIPPVGFMTVGFGMAMRYSKKRDEDQQNGDQQNTDTSE